jgi:hypothetical protein
VDGRDHPLLVAVVADRAAQHLHPARQRGLADVAPTPDLVEQLGLRHHPVAVLEQVDQQAEDLRLDVDQLAGAPQLEPAWVDLAVLEPVHHAATSPQCRSSANQRFGSASAHNLHRFATAPPSKRGRSRRCSPTWTCGRQP